MKLTPLFLKHLKKPTKNLPPAIVVVAEIQDDDSDSVKFLVNDDGEESSHTLMSFRSETTTEEREIRAIRKDRTRFLALRLDLIKALGGAGPAMTSEQDTEYKALSRKLAQLRRIVPATYAQAAPETVSTVGLSSKGDFNFEALVGDED